MFITMPPLRPAYPPTQPHPQITQLHSCSPHRLPTHHTVPPTPHSLPHTAQPHPQSHSSPHTAHLCLYVHHTAPPTRYTAPPIHHKAPPTLTTLLHAPLTGCSGLVWVVWADQHSNHLRHTRDRQHTYVHMYIRSLELHLQYRFY